MSSWILSEVLSWLAVLGSFAEQGIKIKYGTCAVVHVIFNGVHVLT